MLSPPAPKPIGRHLKAVKARADCGHDVFEVHNMRGVCVGTVEWYDRWREAIFVPAQGAVFSHSCLLALAKFVQAQCEESCSLSGDPEPPKPVCLRCGHSVCEFCLDWCDQLTDDQDNPFCCDAGCQYDPKVYDAWRAWRDRQIDAGA